ncbi:MAG: O-methyltransferase, partial [Candidatus Latescibacteria bacterium]|nr:O-methyltransferase [Candidatus Latescibacterota bacterium]
MPKILTETVDQYVTNLMPDRDEVLTEMEQIAKEQSISIIGPLVGRLLYQMAVMIGARRIFEMGSAIRYSTIWLARAVG